MRGHPCGAARGGFVPAAILLLFVAVVLAPSTTAAAATTRGADEARAEERLFAEHNRARLEPAAYGYAVEPTRRPLLWAEDLADVARAWSDRMASAGRVQHNPTFASDTCCWLAVAENVGTVVPSSESIGAAAERLLQLWMDSAGHRRTIMSSGHTQIGLGVAIDPRGAWWVTAIFRAPTADAPSGATSYPVISAAANEPWPGPSPTIRSTRAACPEDGSVPDAGFEDLRGDARIHAVDCLVWWRISGGTSPTSFSPSNLVRRDQVASFVARAIERSGGHLPTPGRHRFDDVPLISPHAGAVNALAEAGIIGGYADGTFRPGDRVTRAQMSRFLVEGFTHRTGGRLPAPSTVWFSDIDGDAFADDINKIAEAGWAGGRGDGTYRPGDGVRRDHMALFLTRWLAHLIEDGYAVGR
jgi:uncharacterized protein YkwD